ncbi:Copper-exporting P-type ATPase [Sporomusa silvacetica DSM 10669]|uniref:Copper-exporting P-type ATPase n=1 Tax=Sporomusa silvacetica DSM 10669 TaxID=1123289 RepID=A0ABZ3IH22_9FIRM|nr:heavy metal-associated domain-containing protein [Sporomusa silvacetica]OZC14807.1 copper-exporting P-type ATPase A [Sporomusa silvacetica DSM 10669]
MAQAETIIIKIQGMACNGCRGKVERALQAIDGVTYASVDLAKKEAVVTGSVAQAELIKVVTELGFEASL